MYTKSLPLSPLMPLFLSALIALWCVATPAAGVLLSNGDYTVDENGLLEATWVINRTFQRWDCTNKAIISVNGRRHSPNIDIPYSPTMPAEGWHIKIKVYNDLQDETTSIHWHGFHHKPAGCQGATPYMDGTPSFTQSDIQPKDFFLYDFYTGNQTGLFWWHAHSGGQRLTGLRGVFQIRRNPAELPYTWDYELPPFIVEGWYHQNYNDHVATHLQSPPQGAPNNPGDASLVMFNAQGFLNCSQRVGAAGSGLGWNRFAAETDDFQCDNSIATCPGWPVYDVPPNSVIRLPIVGAGFDQTPVVMRIAGHSMTVVEADLHPVEPAVFDSVLLMPAVRYIVLITTDQTPGNYYVTGRGQAPNFRGGHAILHYTNAAAVTSAERRTAFVPQTPLPTQANGFQDPFSGNSLHLAGQLKMHPVVAAQFPVPIPTRNETIILRQRTGPETLGFQAWTFNHEKFMMPQTPQIFTEYFGLDNDVDLEDYVLDLEVGEVVKIKFLIDWPRDLGLCLRHPLHFHGMDVWVTGSGWFEYNSSETNYINPARKDTHLIDSPYLYNTPPVPGGAALRAAEAPCAWAEFILVADNPGPWFVHCHIDGHMEQGFGGYIRIRDHSKPHYGLPRPPKDMVFDGPQVTWAHYAELAATALPPPTPQCDFNRTLGCADGTREGFTDLDAFPHIAACAGNWTQPGVQLSLNLVPLCGRQAGNDGSEVEGCSAADLCQEGWHVCSSPSDLVDAAGSAEGCLAGDYLSDATFFATRTSGSGAGKCVADASDWANDVFGCGSPSGSTNGAPFTPGYYGEDCDGLNRLTGDNCDGTPEGGGSLLPGVTCDATGTLGWTEAFVLTSNEANRGGVMCCKGEEEVAYPVTTGPVCEPPPYSAGTEVSLICPPDTVISIVGATYGRTSATICDQYGYVNDLSCADDSLATSYASAACNGLQICDVVANLAFFGYNDPCPGTLKYSTFTYDCVEA